MDMILETSGIPLLAAVVTIYFGIRVYFLGDYSVIRGAGKNPPSDPKAYCRDMGRLMFVFAGGGAFDGGAGSLQPAARVFGNSGGDRLCCTALEQGQQQV